jgi:hypothetical protein
MPNANRSGNVSTESALRGHRLIIKGGVTPAWGLAEAEVELSDTTKDTSSTR